jgi:hypothetical protein
MWDHIENSKQIFPEKELRGLSPNFHIHFSVSDLQRRGRKGYIGAERIDENEGKSRKKSLR